MFSVMLPSLYLTHIWISTSIYNAFSLSGVSHLSYIFVYVNYVFGSTDPAEDLDLSPHVSSHAVGVQRGVREGQGPHDLSFWMDPCWSGQEGNIGLLFL